MAIQQVIADLETLVLFEKLAMAIVYKRMAEREIKAAKRKFPGLIKKQPFAYLPVNFAPSYEYPVKHVYEDEDPAKNELYQEWETKISYRLWGSVTIFFTILLPFPCHL